MSSLLDRIISGDNDAILSFYTLYSPRILRYIQSKLPRGEDAEEVLNDVFFDAIDNLPLFQKRSSIATWLYTIARNKVADFYRKRKIKSVLLSQVPYLEIIANEINQPEFQFEKDKIRDRIEFCLQKLSKNYREILMLHYEEKLSVKQLALHFNLSFKATESLLFRARKQFKQMYERT
jgi:RNA polymerase sigma factor (sigma-70 family)